MRRWIAPVLALFFVLLSAASVSAAVAAVALKAADDELDRWRSPKAEVIAEDQARVERYLGLAERLNPWNPRVGVLRGRMGLLALHRLASGPRERGRLANQARRAFLSAIRREPSAPFNWSDYALATWYAGEHGAVLDFALERALLLGPNEEAVRETAVFLGLARWRDMDLPRRVRVLDMAGGLSKSALRRVKLGLEGRISLRDACASGSGGLMEVKICRPYAAKK
ncbi:MAG: hypothetical protein ACPGU7_06545 [Gammaproteobacteria bacterium]